MRLTLNNIAFVRLHYYFLKGTYSYFVGMKSRKVSDSRCFGCFETPYKFEDLPKTVQVFIHQADIRTVIDEGEGFKVILLKMQEGGC